MTTRVHIRLPFGNHLGVHIEQFAPGQGALTESKTVAELIHGERFEGYVHSASAYVVSEMPLLQKEPRELTRAERLAGVNFNPGGNPMVSESKAGYAERLAEIEMLLRSGPPIDTDQANFLVAARDHLLAAQMLVTKAITWSK